MPVQIAKEIHKPIQNVCGWMNTLADALRESPYYELIMLFPISKKEQTLKGKAGEIFYYSFFQNTINPECYEQDQEIVFESILEKHQPDIVHIWGSEYPHTLAMVKACEKKGLLENSVISIQGLVSVCAQHYYANLPQKVINGKTLRDLLRWNGIREAKKKFEIRGIFETEALQKVHHIIGRTEWDKACVKAINPNIAYHQKNEILRTSFYEDKWDLKKCQRHSIFVSQWGYPLKGFHIFLDAFKNIVRDYPDAKLITTGKDLFNASKKERLKQTYYDKYIIKLIKQWNLEKNIVFSGRQLDETEMKKQYLKAHVFALPSAIENSPNSMGEAMLLGTPVVVSNVGGVSSMLTHGKEGFSYPFDEPYMLAHYIKCIFQDDTLAEKLSNAGRLRASQTHHIQKNIASYLQLYTQISKKT